MIRSFSSYFPKIKGIKSESSQDSIGMVMFAARHDIKIGNQTRNSLGGISHSVTATSWARKKKKFIESGLSEISWSDYVNECLYQ